jgi:hypothetical protein
MSLRRCIRRAVLRTFESLRLPRILCVWVLGVDSRCCLPDDGHGDHPFYLFHPLCRRVQVWNFCLHFPGPDVMFVQVALAIVPYWWWKCILGHGTRDILLGISAFARLSIKRRPLPGIPVSYRPARLFDHR